MEPIEVNVPESLSHCYARTVRIENVHGLVSFRVRNDLQETRVARDSEARCQTFWKSAG